MKAIQTSGWSAVLLLGGLVNPSLAQEETSIFSKATNDSLLWGPYRPNLYFGIRPRQPSSLISGLMWGRVEDFTQIQHNIRYTCEQGDDMQGYGWDAYDPRTGGVQTIHDKGNGIDLETSFVKFDEGWGARIKGTVREDAEVGQSLKTSLWLNAGLEGLGSLQVHDAEANEDLGFDGNVVLKGESNDLGEFTFTITEPEGKNSHPLHGHPSYQTKPLDRTLVHSVQVPAEAIWQAKGTSDSPDLLQSRRMLILTKPPTRSDRLWLDEDDYRYLPQGIHPRQNATTMADVHDRQSPW